MKSILTLIFLSFSILTCAQDIIVKTNGKKIYCKVVNVDSSRVYFNLNEGLFVNSIDRNEVKEIQYKGRSSSSFDNISIKQNNSPYFTSRNKERTERAVVHKHQGLYLSMSLGPVFGKVTDDLSISRYEMSGTGAAFDFKIGGVIGENFILHGTLISQVLPGPSVKASNGTSGKASDNLNVGEAMFGGGFTYYFMPSNLFLSTTIGTGNFSIIDNDNSSNNVSTQRGLSMQLKLGKEWWLSNRWAMGLAFTYGKTKLTNRPDNNTEEQLDSNRFGILLNVTLN